MTLYKYGMVCSFCDVILHGLLCQLIQLTNQSMIDYVSNVDTIPSLASLYIPTPPSPALRSISV
jgi:ABC-type proline/glycine betaine transport system permease subunit